MKEVHISKDTAKTTIKFSPSKVYRVPIDILMNIGYVALFVFLAFFLYGLLLISFNNTGYSIADFGRSASSLIVVVLIISGFIVGLYSLGVTVILGKDKLTIKSSYLVFFFKNSSVKTIERNNIEKFSFGTISSARGSLVYRIIFTLKSGRFEYLRIPDFYATKQNLTRIISELSEQFKYDMPFRG